MNNPDICSEEIVHTDIVCEVGQKMPPEEDLALTAELFKVFGDPTRAKIICALTIQELCVCDIAELLGMTLSAVSHQLRILRQSRIIKSRRSGKTVYYRLDDEHISHIFLTAFMHIKEERNTGV